MDEDIYQLLLTSITERGFSLAAVSRQVSPSRDPSWLSKVLRKKRPLRYEHIQRVLEIIGEPHTRFWQRHLTMQTGMEPPGFADFDPAKLLRTAAGNVTSEPPPVVTRIVARGLPPLEAHQPERLPQQLRDLDRLRMRDPARARAHAVRWIEDCDERVLTERPSASILAELLLALVAFASLLNSKGESRLAASLLAFAFEQLRGTPTGLVSAYLFWRSGPVLSDSGYAQLALAFLERAHSIFQAFGLSDEASQVAVSIGVQHSYLGSLDLSRRYYLLCLHHPEADEDTRLMALANLANDCRRLHQPDQAIALVEQLETIPFLSEKVTTSARWIRANALSDSGELDAAAELFAGLGHDVARYCTVIDPMLLFCDYASVLLKLGDAARLRAAAELALEHVPRLPDPDASWIVREVRSAFEKAASDTLRAQDVTRLRLRLGAYPAGSM